MSSTGGDQGFPRAWRAEILPFAPMIAPARQYTWPRLIPGEEDALARGALHVMVRPGSGGSFLLHCALGFTDPAMPSGVWGCPDPEQICAVAGGYAYLANINAPGQCTQLPLRPVVEVRAALDSGLLLFAGFQTIIGWGTNGQVWETPRLSWDGLRITEATGEKLLGSGWDLLADEEVPFRVDLRTGAASGGGYRLP